MSSRSDAEHRRVGIITLGCARNEVDSDELAGRLSANSWELVDPDDSPDVVLVNTCGFIESAKQESIDTILASGSSETKVVAVGCLAERYGTELAAALPEAAVVGFDAYPEIENVLNTVVSGGQVSTHAPRDRRTLIPISPVERRGVAASRPAPGWSPPGLRARLGSGPIAPVKLASGCDRRCSFCAIPRFRGAYVSREPFEIRDEIAFLADEGVREVNLVSENSTSYGKDLGNLRLLETILPSLAQDTGITRLRIAYLQPAEMRPGLIQVIAAHPNIASYFDLSFQHASNPVLRRMRRFGDTEAFLDLIAQIRAIAPTAGIRSNVIVGFPGETEADLAELQRFLEEAQLDAVGVFGYSDEDETEAATLPDKIDPAVISQRVSRITDLANELMEQRAEARIGETAEVIVESIDPSDEGWIAEGHAGHQGPDDGTTYVRGTGRAPAIGDIIAVTISGTEGIDLRAEYAL
ncbi:MAG: hypothetical protein RJB01_750 [Actinomycetota bacterium]